ncbi:site-2 protease family protein [Alicyclobacillus sendaiensis]|uniref:site-2 protease family protein n=1 Tax=Alicyclobacillus sendaiensis TaxID=192387 RepID=UPI0026F47208|nr:site-2 protease family protein [Alicyclobacillus sendaiensis]
MLNGFEDALTGLLCLVRHLLPHTSQGWIAVAVSLPFILHVQIFLHEFAHFVCRKVLGVPTRRMTIGAGPLVFRVRNFELRWIPTSGSVGPGVYCMDLPIRRKLWVYRSGILANGLSVLLWVKNPIWVLCGLMMVWANTRVVVFPDKQTMSDGAWIALLRGGFRLPEGFDPCAEDSKVEGTQEG